MIIMYKFTEIKSEKWWAKFFLKGAFSCFVILFWYNFCYNIYYLRLADKDSSFLYDSEWQRGCGVSFSIIFGLCCIIFSFIFKDILMCFLNILFYIGFSIYYFNLPEVLRNTKQFNENGDGIVDMIILVFSIILFFYQIIEKIIEKDNEIKAQLGLLNNSQNQKIYNSEVVNLINNQNEPKTETLISNQAY